MAETEKNFTLLLVDDNPTNLLLLVKIIELDLPEVRVLSASSAQEGLQLAELEQIDGAFIAVQMPQMGGLDMCRQLRKNPRTAAIPLALMSAHITTPEMRAEGFGAGAYDFISLPISNVEMLARIKVMLRFCESKQHSAENNQQLQQQVTDYEGQLRWISALMAAGQGELAAQDQQLLRQLVDNLPDPAKTNDQLFFEKLITGFPLPWYRTLLELALLDYVPVSLAQKLSKVDNIIIVFEYLSRYRLASVKVVEGEECFFFKPQIREILGKKAAQDLSLTDRQQVFLIAADWYCQKENFVAALEVLISAQEYSAVSRLLSWIGLTLLDTNYQRQIAPLIEKIPEQRVNACGWLALFRACNDIYKQSAGSVSWLQLAYQRFQEEEDPRGELLVLAQEVCQVIFIHGHFEHWGDRLVRFQVLAEELSPRLTPVERLKVAFSLGLVKLFFTESLATVDIILKESLAEAQRLNLFDQQLEMNLLRALYALRQGRFLVSRTAMEHGLSLAVNRSELPHCLWLQTIACVLLRDSGDLAGLQNQQQRFMTIAHHGAQQPRVISSLISYYTVTLLLARGQRQAAVELLDLVLLDGKTTKSASLYNRFLQLRGWIHALSGDKTAALCDLEAGLTDFVPGAAGLFGLENLLFAGGTCYALADFVMAEKYFTQGLLESVKYHDERFRSGFHAWLAVTQQQLGQLEAAAENVEGFIDLFKRDRLNFFWGFIPELLEELLPLMGQKKQQQLLQPLLKNQLTATLDQDCRPIALLRVRCFGHFQLTMGKESFDLSLVGQASRQIFALLLISPNCQLSSERLMGILWPESSPQKARNSFDTALSRLRRGLEECFGQSIRQSYLVLNKGILSLQNLQVDSLQFAETMRIVRSHLQRENFWQAEHALWKMDRLWGGEFLYGYDLDGDLPLQREQLFQLRLEQLSILAQLLTRRHHQEEAVRLLQQGLFLDSTYDPIIRQLLFLYRQQRNIHAVDRLLEKYRSALQEEEYTPEEIDEMIEILST